MNNTKYCFYSNRTFNQISTFESFVFTFYLNERVKTQKITLVQMKVIMYLYIDALIHNQHVGIICKEI